MVMVVVMVVAPLLLSFVHGGDSASPPPRLSQTHAYTKERERERERVTGLAIATPAVLSLLRLAQPSSRSPSLLLLALVSFSHVVVCDVDRSRSFPISSSSPPRTVEWTSANASRNRAGEGGDSARLGRVSMASFPFVGASPAFLAPPASPPPSTRPADERAVLRALEEEVDQQGAWRSRSQQPSPLSSGAEGLFCSECLAKCESHWDVVAGPHTGHSCLPLSVALRVLPSALCRQVERSVGSWQEFFEKPRRAQAQQLDEQTAYLREQQRQKRQALVRLLTELAETERELALTTQAKAVAACNWRYQRERMRQQAQRWREGCERLRLEVVAQQQQQQQERGDTTVKHKSGGTTAEAWAHSWAAAHRELARLATVLDQRITAWAEEDRAAEEAVCSLKDEPQKGRDAAEETAPAASEWGRLTPPFAAAATSTLKGTQPQPHPVVSRSGHREGHTPSHDHHYHHQHHHYPSSNAFAVTEEGRWRATKHSIPADEPAETAGDGSDGSDGGSDGGPSSEQSAEAAARAERQRRLAERRRALNNAIEQLTRGNDCDGGGGGRGPSPGPAPPPPRPAPCDVRSSKSSSLESLQQQLLEELQREQGGGA